MARELDPLDPALPYGKDEENPPLSDRVLSYLGIIFVVVAGYSLGVSPIIDGQTSGGMLVSGAAMFFLFS